jgi:hypothetical protein
MKESKKAILSISLAFLILCAVSLYRQLSLRFLPDDAARPAVVYSVYVLLTIWWGLSLRRRITQKNIRVFLYGEVTVMLFWLTIRFIQDGFLTGTSTLCGSSGILSASLRWPFPCWGCTPPSDWENRRTTGFPNGGISW